MKVGKSTKKLHRVVELMRFFQRMNLKWSYFYVEWIDGQYEHHISPVYTVTPKTILICIAPNADYILVK
jgi:hypothetical protein